MTTTPNTYPARVTECFVTSDQKLHTSAEAADVWQAKLNADAAEAERAEEQRRQKFLRVAAIEKEREEQTALLKPVIADYNMCAEGRYRGVNAVRLPLLLQSLEAYGLKVVLR